MIEDSTHLALERGYDVDVGHEGIEPAVDNVARHRVVCAQVRDACRILLHHPQPTIYGLGFTVKGLGFRV